MLIDKSGIIVFVSAALASTCDAFLCRVPVQRQVKPLQAFASDRGESTSQYEHFAISTDPSAPSTLSQETTTSIAPPQMARPTENSKLAKVDNNTNDAIAAAPQTTLGGDDQPMELKQSVWERNKAAEVQGGSLRTWSFANQHKIDMIQVHMKTDGRPMNANVELWQGPDNIPQKVAVYVEDGRARPFRCFVATPYTGNSISIRNTNTLEYPLQAILEGGKVGMDDPETQEKMQRIQTAKPTICQGGAVITERFEPEVQSVQVFLQSEGRPLQCRIELIQGPNNVKQVMEVYTEEGSTRPFYTIIETPGYGTGVVRIINSSTMEFPFSATVQPWDIGYGDDDFNAMSTGGSPFFEISGGAEGRSVAGPTDDMGDMFGSIATSGSSTVTESEGGGLASLFDSSASVQSTSSSPSVESEMVSPKKSLPPPAPVSEEPTVFLENEEFASSSSTSSLSQDATPIITTTATSKKASPKMSTTLPSQETDTEIRSKSVDEAEPEPLVHSEDDLPPSPPTQSSKPVLKRYTPPPPPPVPKQSSRVFLDIEDAYK